MSLKGAVDRTSLAILVFFGTKIVSGLLLLKLSAAWLSTAEFSIFSQFLLLGALVTIVGAGGAQHGIVRETAADGGASLDSIVSGGGVLWLSAVALVLPLAVITSPQLSHVLTGTSDYAVYAALIVAAALLSGPGQIVCAVLTGLRASGTSLASQGAGLVVGTAAATVLIWKGQPAAAALSFYLGALATVPISGVALLRRRRVALPHWKIAVSQARRLLRYSGAFLFVATFTAVTLFGLRYAYLSSFDPTALSYWMVAQRVSDTSTQLLGLFMAQQVLPVVATSSSRNLRTVLLRFWLMSTGIMLALLAIFAAAPSLWTRLLLSTTYLPAVGFIVAYMVGDALRATASLAMHAALARSRILIYVGIEVAATSLMAVITLVLLAQGERWAPIAGYVGAYLITALALGGVALVNSRSRPTLSPGR